MICNLVVTKKDKLNEGQHLPRYCLACLAEVDVPHCGTCKMSGTAHSYHFFCLPHLTFSLRHSHSFS